MISRLFFLLAIFFGLIGLANPSGFVLAIIFLVISILTKPEKKDEGLIGSLLRELGETDCPYCKETIKKDAIKCKHCGSHLKASKSKTAKAIDITPRCKICNDPIPHGIDTCYACLNKSK